MAVENPYASVNIQLESSFIKHYLGQELPSPTVVVNPGTVPTSPAPEQLSGASKSVPLPRGNRQRGGMAVENPYASVNIQLESSFIKHYLGQELPSRTVVVNPGTMPTSPAPEQLSGASKSVPLGSWDGSKVLTRKSRALPYNPYGSLKLLNDTSSALPYTIELDKHQKSPEVGTDSGCCCCCKCCPRCRKCCCVVS
ncbi:cysteine-rich tail protein 1-like [Mauremys mutica]|uniref:cysteine-rich tail protein 1-like n=1 Tax=Mauremys mutica TaxID=74926 RepID=UPI001D144688|nr:cysteine-rich tail protein 1-like [Mauremys mutica]